MEIVNNLILWFVSVSEIGICYFFSECLAGQKFIKQHRAYFFMISIVIGCFLYINRIKTGLLSWAMILLQTIIITISIYIKSRKQILFKMGAVLACNVCIGIFQLLGAFLELLLFPNIDIGQIYYQLGIYRNINYLFAFIVLGAIYGYVRYRSNKFDSIDKYKWAFFIYGIAGLLFIVLFQNRILVFGRDRSFETISFLILIVICEILFFIGSIENASIKVRVASLELRDQLMRDNYKEVYEMFQNYFFTYHDFKNHLILLEEYCREGNVQKAFHYIQKIVGTVPQIKRYIYVGNEIADIIINYKLKKIEDQGIKLEVQADYIKMEWIKDEDICSILSNLMDNAIEGCSTMKNPKWISLYFKDIGDAIMIKVCNSYSGKISIPEGIKMKVKGAIPVHGYGMKSVKNKVESYGGTVRWSADNEVYSAVITFNK